MSTDIRSCTAGALAVYAVLAYRRLSSSVDYHHQVNVKGYGFNDGLDQDFSYPSKTGIRPTLEKRLSSASSRLSFSGRRNEQPQEDAQPLSNIKRTPSYYNHERDTQFDDYIARRSSSVSTKHDVERAMGVEFGWSTPPGEPDKDDDLSMGVVKTRARGLSMPRAPSMASDHVLVAVPEEEDEAATKAEHEAKTREALLGNSARSSDEMVGVQVPQEVDLAEPRWQREQ